MELSGSSLHIRKSVNGGSFTTSISLLVVGCVLLLFLVCGLWSEMKPKASLELLTVVPGNTVAAITTNGNEEQGQPRESITLQNVNVSLPPYYSLGKPIANWDKYRQQWLATTAPHPNPRLFVVTGSQPGPCPNPTADHFLLRAFKNKVDYCLLHGLHIFYNVALFDRALDRFWAKLPLLRAAMVAHPEAEWLWWIDSDAIVTDMGFEIPLEKYKGHNLVVHGWEKLIFENRSWVGANAGSFLIRNCGWSLKFMERWAAMGGPVGAIREAAGRLQSELLPDRPRDWPGDDQSALIYLMIRERREWGEKIYVEDSYNLNGYWVEMVEKYEKKEERKPFVTHFTGCQPCSGRRSEKYGKQQCEDGMERALNFADNQILQRFGFKHEQLDMAEIDNIA